MSRFYGEREADDRSPGADFKPGGSSVIYLGHIPGDWDEQIIKSVVAGSGKVVDIRPRFDSSGKGKNFCFVEYSNPTEATRALQLLSEIRLGPKRKLRVELSKEGLRSNGSRSKPVLNLNRNFLPYYVQIPAAMRESSAEPENLNPQQLQQLQQQQLQQQPNSFSDSPYGANNSTTATAATNNTILTSPITKEEPLPDVLAKASSYLPAFNPSAFNSDDKVSSNLKSIPPVQLIELISTLKNLVSTDITSVQNVLGMSQDIPVTVVQALILMGLIDINVITAALQPPSQLSAPTIPSLPAVPTLPTPPTLPTSPLFPPSSSYNSGIAGASVLNNTPSYQAVPPPPPVSKWPNLPSHTAERLARLDPNEATMIAQVLTLAPESISALPPQQRQMVVSIRAQYL